MKEKPYVKVAMYALNIIFAIIIIVPVIYCFNVSMMDLKEIYGGKFWPSHLTIENYTRAFQLAPFFTFIKNSLIVSGVITFAQVVTGALAAYAFAMMEFKGKKVLFYIMLATMMIPSQAIIIANYLTIADWGIRNTYAALILPNAAAAFAVFNMRQAFLTLPKEIHEAAEIDGAGIFKIFYKIILPTCTPILATVAIFSAVGQWNNYQDTLIYITDQKLYSLQYLLYTYINQASSLAAMVRNSGTAAISTAALATQQTGTSIQMTVSVVVVLPILCIYPMFQRFFVKGIMIGSVKG